MRAVVQRVKRARVEVDHAIVGNIDAGVLVFLGVGREDTEKDADYLAEKIANLRIFGDEEGKMSKSILDLGLGALVVPQFTIWGDCRKGRRPSFSHAAPPEQAEQMYEYFVRRMNDTKVHTEKGRFQAMMDVHLINDGPVTLLLDSSKLF
ncbi:MAG: D-tyrosyl-tRNA(Tyr) deacylase [Deltaproteobacteria bacterium]|nr:D-tyrosyl-tRNA(Tyr) deacylase [Deltaproteobacteria bacterium]